MTMTKAERIESRAAFIAATWDREHDTPATRKEATQLWFG